MIQPPDLSAALHAGLQRKEGTPWRRDHLHVSDLGVTLEDGGCARQLWLRTRGFEERPETVGESLMFEHANSIHARAVPILKRGLAGTGWTIDFHELKLDGLLPEGVTGRCDLVMTGPKGEKVIPDIKTVRGKAFSYLAKPKSTHVLQVQTYSRAFGADFGMLLYVDREGSNGTKQFLVDRDDDAVDRAIQRAKVIIASEQEPPILVPIAAITENKGPDSIRLEQPWQCAYCRNRWYSCMGALPSHLVDLGIVAKREKPSGKLIPTQDTDAGRQAFSIVAELLGAEMSPLEKSLFGPDVIPITRSK